MNYEVLNLERQKEGWLAYSFLFLFLRFLEHQEAF